MLTFSSKTCVAVGEAMIEMAVVGEDTYRRSFAGDTFNTAWHMVQLPGAQLDVAFATKVGTDAVSDTFADLLQQDGLDPSRIGRVPDRTMGLYMIELDGAERTFHYWRTQSAARCLADDPAWLDQALADTGLIHVSGITLAILSPDARTNLCTALATARSKGARVSFDPNVRPRLWQSPDETRDTLTEIFKVTDIALPSFDDEAALWGDPTPADTVARFRDAGVAEIIVKNGAGVVHAQSEDGPVEVPTPPADTVRDTSGAGDAFNAGYLAARLMAKDQVASIKAGQTLAAEVIRHFGARIPKGQVPSLSD